MTIYKVNLLVALWLTLAYNLPFLLGVLTSIAGPIVETIFLCLFLLVCLFLLNYLLVVCLNVKRLYKPCLIILFLISSILLYSSSTGKQYNPSAFEMSQWLAGTGRFITFGFAINTLFLFLLPSFVLMKTELRWDGFKWHTLKTIATILSLCALLSGIYHIAEKPISPHYNVARSELVNVIPAHFIDSSLKYLHHQYFEPAPIFTILDNEPVLAEPTLHKTLVLVLAESVRAASFGATHLLDAKHQAGQQNVISACDTSAMSSSQCIFSLLSRTAFIDHNATHQQNVLDILSLAGVNIYWLSNDGSCGDICKRAKVDERKLECDKHPCYDHELIDLALTKILNTPQTANQSNLIIIQTQNIGSPLYSRFYPHTYASKKPECKTLLVSNCDRAELMNSYSNAIKYMKYVLTKANSALNNFHRQHPQVATSLVFTSKYGESLGEKGYYFHGSPKAVAPSEQLQVPLLIVDEQLPHNCLSTLNTQLSHDSISHTLLGYFHVKSKVYSANFDIAAVCGEQLKRTKMQANLAQHTH